MNIREQYVGVNEQGEFDGTTITPGMLKFVDIPNLTQTYTHYHIHNADFLPEHSDPLKIKARVEEDVRKWMEENPNLDEAKITRRHLNYFIVLKFFFPSLGDITEYLSYLPITRDYPSIVFKFVIITPFGKLQIQLNRLDVVEEDLILKYREGLGMIIANIANLNPDIFDDLNQFGDTAIKVVNAHMQGDLIIELHPHT